MSVRSASRLPVQTLLSGPASGVRGAMFVGKLAGTEQLITFDLGGTSADIAIVNGKIPYATENKVADFPMIMPVVDITSIGAGGGSVAWMDGEGVLKVGPHSAGADPGPAAYNRGGQDATLTDAYIAVGLLDPKAFLGGGMPLSADRAHAAIERLARQLGLSVTETAEAIIRVATANMYAELLPLMARAGADAETFALVPYGGAGPTHAFLLATEVGIRRVIVPLQPGTLCALGCLIADVQGDFIRTVHTGTGIPRDAEIAGLFEELAEDARAWLEAQGAPARSVTFQYGADMRYHGQSFETPVHAGMSGDVTLARLQAAFHEQYRQIYGYADPTAAMEIINLRVTIIGETPKPAPVKLAPSGTTPQPLSHRPVHLGASPLRASVYQRGTLAAGQRFSGPAIIEQYDSTIFIPSQYRVEVDSYGNLIGTLQERS
jgi:N-methylhydantoinase A